MNPTASTSIYINATNKYAGVISEGATFGFNGDGKVGGWFRGDSIAMQAIGYNGALSGKFSGGAGVEIDSLKVGSGARLGRIGTAAAYDDWFGTQAQYDANTPKTYFGVSVYPQASTTKAYIKD